MQNENKENQTKHKPNTQATNKQANNIIKML